MSLEATFAEFEPFDYPEDRHPAESYIAKLGRGESQRTARVSFGLLAELAVGDRIPWHRFPWHRLRYHQTNALRTALAVHYNAPGSANLRLAHLRQVLRECWRLGWMELEEQARAADLEKIRGNAVPRGRALEQDELRAIFGACGRDPTAAGRRDGAILLVLYGTGLRRREVAALLTADVDLEREVVTVRRGKGRKSRRVGLPMPVSRAIREWLAVRPRGGRHLFVRLDRGGLGKPISDSAVLNICRKRQDEAEVARFSPHDLRRTFTTELLESGVDPLVTAALLGHASIETTRKYDRRGVRAEREALERLRFPL